MPGVVKGQQRRRRPNSAQCFEALGENGKVLPTNGVRRVLPALPALESRTHGIRPTEDLLRLSDPGSSLPRCWQVGSKMLQVPNVPEMRTVPAVVVKISSRNLAAPKPLRRI